MNDWDEGNFKFIAVIFVGVLLYLLGYFFFVTPAHSQSLDTQSSIDSAQAATNYINNNSIYIDQIGSNNTIYIQQNSSQSGIAGPGQNSMPIQGTGNTVKIRQGDQIGRAHV